MRHRHRRRMAGQLSACAMICLMIGTAFCSASAEPWLSVGDSSLRSDIEILADRGLIDSPVTTWPIPAGQVERLSDLSALAGEPDFVQLSAQRVLERLIGEGQPAGWHPEAVLQTASQPDVVRDFDSLARNEWNGRAGIVYDGERISGALRIGGQSRFNQSQAQFAMDGSYLSGLVGDWQLYGGWVDQWYGPGWTSSLILSNNARPFPRLGIMRNIATAPESSLLHWLGPWQLNVFVGLLDDQRYDRNTAIGGFRLTFAPVRNVEIGLSRLTEFCGEHHSCSPLKAAFQLSNNSATANTTNDEAAVDIRYSHAVGQLTVAPYLQMMNEDTGPFTHSDTSYLAGVSFAGPYGRHGAQWRATVEYATTVPTVNMFGFDRVAHGVAYNNSGYVDGMRYRGRTLGFSLDSDSRLLSIGGRYIDEHGWSYHLVYYRANISSQQLSDAQMQNGTGMIGDRNSVSSVPVALDQIELGISIPFRSFSVGAGLRAKDAAVSPDETSRISGEIGIAYRF